MTRAVGFRAAGTSTIMARARVSLLRLMVLSGFFCVLCKAGATTKTEAREAFDEAVAAYEEGNYPDAYSKFSDVAAHYVSPELFANTGNAAFRIGSDGEAALWYRRAQVMDSKQAEAAQNLRFLKRRLGFLRFEGGALAQYGSILRKPAWRLLFALACGTAAVSLAVLIFLKIDRSIRVGLIWGVVLGVVFGGVTGLGLWVKSRQRELLSLYIVTATEVSALAAPNGSAGHIVALPPGTEVAHLEQRGPWMYVEIPGSSRGWIRASQAELLWPYSVRLAE